MLKINFEKIYNSFVKNDIVYFFYSVLFYEVFFKLTRRYYFDFENNLTYYFSLFNKNLFYNPYSFLMLSLVISCFAIIFNKLLFVGKFTSNIFAFTLIFFLLKISDFPRTNFLYLFVLFPLFYLVLSKVNLNLSLKLVLLILPLFVSVSNQSYYFEARQSSYLSNASAQDFSFEEIIYSQDVKEPYISTHTVDEYRKLFFKDITVKEFVLCCEDNSLSKNWKKSVGYLEKYEDNLIFISGKGEMYSMSLSNLLNESSSGIKKIDTNFKELVKNEYVYGVDKRFKWGGWESVRNIYYSDGHVYISYISEVDKECVAVSILKGMADLDEIEFTKFFTLNECIPRTSKGYTAAQSGGAIANYDEENIIMTVGDFRQTNLPQDVNSQYGKTLRINKTDGSYEILTLGHRNPQGIKKISKDLFISTEHGPRMGDEINIIDTTSNNNYGWPIASYGVPYRSQWGINFVFEESIEIPRYEKSHKNLGFVEPIYYFGVDKVPEHGISDIEIMTNYEDNIDFMFGSLNYGRLYIASYNLTNSTMISLDSYNLGNRIRDILLIDKNNFAILLENPRRIAIISLNNN